MKRGEIYYCEDQLTSGSVVWSKGRPCVIVSSDQIAGAEGYGVVQVVFLTSRPKPDLPTRVRITSTGRESTVLCDQIVAIPKDRLGTRVGTCTAEELREIEKGMLAGLGIAGAPETPRAATSDPLQVARAEAERDAYKQMYEQLLAKVLGETP